MQKLQICMHITYISSACSTRDQPRFTFDHHCPLLSTINQYQHVSAIVYSYQPSQPINQPPQTSSSPSLPITEISHPEPLTTTIICPFSAITSYLSLSAANHEVTITNNNLSPSSATHDPSIHQILNWLVVTTHPKKQNQPTIPNHPNS